MKAKKVSFFLLLLFGLLNQIFSYEKINLSLSPTDSIYPSIAVESNAKILVVWAEKDWPRKGFAGILYETHENGQWSQIEPSRSQMYGSRFQRLVLGPNNNIHLVYADGIDDSLKDIFYRNFSFEDRDWSNIERVYLSESNSSYPAIKVSKSEKVYVMWVHQHGETEKSDVVINSKNRGKSWPESYENVSQDENFISTQPSFKVKNRNVYACWIDNRNGTRDIFFNEKIDGVWKAPTSLDSYGEKKWPSLVIDRENKIHILYSTEDGGTYYIKREDQLWKAPLLLSTALSPAGTTDFKLFKNNTLHAVWRQESESGISIFYNRGTSDGNWQVPVKVAEGKEADWPSMALDDYGNAHIVWEDSGEDGKKDIFYAMVTLSGTKPIASFSCSEESGIVPLTADFDASGSSPGDGDIYSFWWDFGDGSAMKQGPQVAHTFKKPGNFVVKLYVTNSLLLVGIKPKEIQILPGPYPPQNVKVEKTEDGGLFYREKINVVTWEGNPKNNGLVTISFYTVYRKLKNLDDDQFKKIGQVDALTFKYIDRDFLSPEDRDLYTYAVSAVDDQGREGPKSLAAPAASGKGFFNLRKEQSRQ